MLKKWQNTRGLSIILGNETALLFISRSQNTLPKRRHIKIIQKLPDLSTQLKKIKSLSN